MPEIFLSHGARKQLEVLWRAQSVSRMVSFPPQGTNTVLRGRQYKRAMKGQTSSL